MVEFLNRRCIDYGFDGVYIVETISDIHKFVNHSNDNPKLKSEYFFREPSLALSLLNDKRSFGEKVKRKLKRHFVKVFKNIKPDIFDADDLYTIMLKNESVYCNCIRGAFFSWDNTPRHANRGYVINEVSKEKFFEYMNSIKETDMLFINAWNE